MRRINRSAFAILSSLIVLLTAFLAAAFQAQPPTITLSIAVQDFVESQFFSTNHGQLIKDFESAHPGVKVNVIAPDGFHSNPAYASTPEDYFKRLEQYANSADVLYVSGFTLTPEAVDGGYFLDLTPYTSVDKTFNAQDFYPGVLQSFQFDNGLWALPNSAGILTTLNYDPVAFDQAGLTYPTEKWTIDDIVNAARKLTQRDAAGNVTRCGFDILYEADFLRSLLPQGTYDPNTSPNMPQFDRPDVVALVKKWTALRKEGVIGPETVAGGGAVTFATPLNVASPYSQQPTHMIPVLLPGGKAGITPQGYAVSSRSHYPQLAYELAEFMTTRLTYPVDQMMYAARQSVTKAAIAQNKTQTPNKLAADKQAFLDNAFQHGIPFSELRYLDYVILAAYNLSKDNVPDVEHALQDAQGRAQKNLQLAQQKRRTVF